MPKGPRGFRARGAAATLDPQDTPITDPQETDTVTAVTSEPADVDTTDDDGDDAATNFEFSMEAAPEGYTPERKTPGRQRRPSFFDDKLRSAEVFGKGWQRVPVSSEEHKAAVIRELSRAKLYLNGTGRVGDEPEIGLDLDDKQDEAVYFKARVAQKRERKSNGGDALTENAAEDGLTDPDGDNDE
jgi:hypothetical protein